MQRRNLILALVFLLAAGGAWIFEQQSPATGEPPTPSDAQGADVLEDAYERRLNDEWVEGRGRVVRLLADDNNGSRHQRFLIETVKGQSLLMAHNIDLAPRVPVAMGDTIRFKGVYEWNERGGVIHWTHHDPQGGAREGYILHQRKRYE